MFSLLRQGQTCVLQLSETELIVCFCLTLCKKKGKEGVCAVKIQLMSANIICQYNGLQVFNLMKFSHLCRDTVVFVMFPCGLPMSRQVDGNQM